MEAFFTMKSYITAKDYIKNFFDHIHSMVKILFSNSDVFFQINKAPAQAVRIIQDYCFPDQKD